jgi:coenzyme Q-binding protein COQ10|tara:strand:- start:399 stop:836 length:438 start_codon:yes stop_codon:yes gene_type:complete
MKESKKEIRLNHTAVDLFNIVLDIEKYPDYIPWCSEIKILEKKRNKIKANMIVNYKFFSEQKFTSDVTFDLNKLLIKTQYIEGPLKDLKTIWLFQSLEEKKSKVIFSIKFEFKNFVHQKLAELFFPLIEKRMVNSFILRASDILD